MRDLEKQFIKLVLGVLCLGLGLGVGLFLHFQKCGEQYYHYSDRESSYVASKPGHASGIQHYGLFKTLHFENVSHCKDGKYRTEVVYYYVIAVGLLLGGLILLYEIWHDFTGRCKSK